jgi:transcriptional antiterminator Rof (Rho-off)
MTLEEFCNKYDYAESSVLHAFPHIKKSILLKHGIIIEKKGRGKKSEYIEIDGSKEKQLKELEEFLDENPHAKEYIESLIK